MKTKKAIPLDFDTLIDRFVETVNRLPRERGLEEDIPASVRDKPDDPESWYVGYDWRITPWPGIDWIAPVEEKLGRRLPPSYRSLVTRYVFPRFGAGKILLHANTPEGVFHEFRDRVFRDPTFTDVLLPLGYVPLANPSTGSYDPVCFDTRRDKGAGECPIVRIEHESVLCHKCIDEIEEIAPSFSAFVNDFIVSHATS